MQPESNVDEPIDLRAFLTVIRRRKLSIAVITLVVVGAALLYSFQQTPIYAGTATVEVQPISSDQLLNGLPLANLISMDTEKAKVESAAVAKLAAEELGTPAKETTDLNELLRKVSVSVDTGTTFMKVSFSDPTPTAAAAGANAFATAYVKDRTAYAKSIYDNAAEIPRANVERLTGVVADLSAQIEAIRDDAERAKISRDLTAAQIQLSQAQAELAAIPKVTSSPAQVALPATLPESPSSPNILLNAVLALIVGLALGIGFAFLRERLDDRLGTREAYEEAMGGPVLAVVPQVPGWKKKGETRLVTLGAPKSPVAEAYRTIRTNLQYIARQGDVRLLSVVSSAQGEGKTTSTANLAVTLAQAGKHVIAVSCDLRKPRLHRFFGLGNGVGVTSIVGGTATVGQAAQRVAGLDTLRVISSGPVPQDPAELLGSAPMLQLLAELRESADFVLLDTAPVLAVSDALILAPESDGVIVVADAGNATRGAVQHLRDQLEQVGGNILGGIFNNFNPANAKYGPGYYRYYYAYRYHDEPARPKGNGKTRAEEPEQLWQA